MRPTHLQVLLLALAGLPACGPSLTGPGRDGGTTTLDGPPPLAGLTGITVTPATDTLSVTTGAPATVTYTAIGHFTGQPDQDVSTRVVWSIDAVALGAFRSNQFSASGVAAGVSTVHATNGGISGTATLTIQLRASVVASGGSPAVPANPGHLFTGSADPTRAPTIFYPYDGVLMPPNMNQLEIQWAPGPSSNTLFDVQLVGPLSRVDVYTRCVPAPTAMQGCSYDLDPAVWEYMASGSRGASVTLDVLATDDSGASVGESAAQRLALSADDVQGGIYYWTTSGGSSVMRYDFGGTATTATKYLDPTAESATCVGCHVISHDGNKLIANYDNCGADGSLGLYSVATRALLAAYPLAQPSDFESWSPDDKQFVGVFGDDGVDLNLLLFDGTSGAHTGDINLGGWEASHPDWAPDGKSIAFTHVGVHDLSQNFAEGAIAVVRQTSAGTWGTPVDLVPRQTGVNHYYPAYSPDGTLLVFDQSTCGRQVTPCNVSWVTVDCSCDADADPSATIEYLPASAAPGTAPTVLGHINAGHPAADMGQTLLTNSWPKWSPILSHLTVGGERIAWITFSSTRAYGFRQLPPGDGQSSAIGSYLWMAAVDLNHAEVGAAADPSYPPFVLPFQDFTTSNHIAQWTTKVIAIQ